MLAFFTKRGQLGSSSASVTSSVSYSTASTPSMSPQMVRQSSFSGETNTSPLALFSDFPSHSAPSSPSFNAFSRGATTRDVNSTKIDTGFYTYF